MTPIAYLNGRYIDAAEARLPVWDAGLVMGATVTEQLRTFHGRLFRLREHLARLRRSLAVVGVDPVASDEQFTEIAAKLVDHNYRLLSAGSDLGLAMLVTPGAYPAFAPDEHCGPTICLHTYPLPFARWAGHYETGVSLVTTPIEQTPAECWPPALKCRSRIHYYLADQAAARIESGSRALLLDREGFVSETATANVLAVPRGEGVVSPPRSKILPGITLDVVRELCDELRISFAERDLTVDDLAGADEILLTSTPSCVLPATRFNGRPIGRGEPGPVFKRLLEAFGRMAGLDIAAQALGRPTPPHE